MQHLSLRASLSPNSGLGESPQDKPEWLLLKLTMQQRVAALCSAISESHAEEVIRAHKGILVEQD
jgi:hypothetical protein